MKAKKLVALIGAAAMTLGATGMQVFAESDDTVKIEWWHGSNPGLIPVTEGSEMYNFYKELIGVGIESPYVEWNGGETYLEQLNLRLAAGDAPDVFFMTGGIETRLIQDGALLDLTDLIPEYAPHLWEAVSEESWDIIRSKDPTGEGRIYMLPGVINYTRMTGLIRQDWLDALDLDMPTTIEEFTDVLRAFKDDDPNGNGIADEIPTGGRAEARWMDHLFAFYGIAMWEGFPQWDIYDGELTYSAVTQNMRDCLEWLAELYEEGLLDEETLLNDKAAWDGEIDRGIVGVYYHWAEYVYTHLAAIKNATGEQAEYAVLPAISADGYEGFYTMMPTSSVTYGVNYTEDMDKIRAIMKVFDAYADPDMLEALYYGVEGMHHVLDENGNKVRLADDPSTQEALVLSPWTAMANVESEELLIAMARIEEDGWAYDQSLTNLHEAQKYGKVIAGDGIPSSIYDGYADIQSRTLYVEYASKIIAGEWPIEKFDEFVEKWYATGGTEVTEAARAWYAGLQEE